MSLLFAYIPELIRFWYSSINDVVQYLFIRQLLLTPMLGDQYHLWYLSRSLNNTFS
jgi:hypothetical protein